MRQSPPCFHAIEWNRPSAPGASESSSSKRRVAGKVEIQQQSVLSGKFLLVAEAPSAVLVGLADAGTRIAGSLSVALGIQNRHPLPIRISGEYAEEGSWIDDCCGAGSLTVTEW